MSTDVSSLIPLKPDVFAILVAVLERPRHGYAIMQAAQEPAAGRRELQAGALYRLLKRMLADGLIEEVEAPVDVDTDDARRRYYRATDLGRRVAAAEIERMRELVTAPALRDLTSEAAPR